MAQSKIIKLLLVIFIFGLFLFWRSLPSLAIDFPKPTGYVNDFAEMFSDDFRRSLEQDLVNFENETTAEIAVVTIETLGDNSLEDYAVRLFEDWKIGKKKEDNGILVLIVKEERKIRIEVGYGLEPVVTDGRAGRIIREKMTSSFKKGNYDQGVGEAVKEIKNYIQSGQPPTGEEAVKEKANESFSLFVVGFILLTYFSSFWGRSKRFWPGGVFGGLMGGFLGWLSGALLTFVMAAVGFGLFGLLLDYLLSKNYQKLRKAGRSTSFFPSRGGFFSGGGGGRGGGGFGGFGGGSSGGGGASGGW